MRLGTVFVGLTILAGACGGLPGCSTAPSGTDAVIKPPESQDQMKENQKKALEGMKGSGGGYKGAPGAPPPK
jgi:hypothetical protein